LKWSILALQKFKIIFEKTAPNRAISIIDNSRSSFHHSYSVPWAIPIYNQIGDALAITHRDFQSSG
jgi:hypothetical protein